MNRLGAVAGVGLGAVIGAVVGGAIGNVARGKPIGRLTYGLDETLGAIFGGMTMAAVASATEPSQPSSSPRFP